MFLRDGPVTLSMPKLFAEAFEAYIPRKGGGVVLTPSVPYRRSKRTLSEREGVVLTSLQNVIFFCRFFYAYISNLGSLSHRSQTARKILYRQFDVSGLNVKM